VLDGCIYIVLSYWYTQQDGTRQSTITAFKSMLISVWEVTATKGYCIASQEWLTKKENITIQEQTFHFHTNCKLSEMILVFWDITISHWVSGSRNFKETWCLLFKSLQIKDNSSWTPSWGITNAALLDVRRPYNIYIVLNTAYTIRVF
jgi:hypothetical protein